MATLSDVRSAVLSNLDRVDAPSAEEANVTRWINQAVREDLCALHVWGSMFSRQTVYLSSGTNSYNWPDPTLWKTTALIGIREDTDSPFVKLTEASLAQCLYDYPRTTEAKPQFWCKRGNGFMVVPTPDVSTYQIEVIGWEYPADLSDDGDTNSFTLYYSRLVEAIATARGALHYGDNQRAVLWEKQAEKWLARALQVDNERMTPFQKTLVPGSQAGTQRLPWGRSRMVSEPAYGWL